MFKKGRKQLKKSILTGFWVLQAPKSWSEYTPSFFSMRWGGHHHRHRLINPLPIVILTDPIAILKGPFEVFFNDKQG